jgi:hypothetical protein
MDDLITEGVNTSFENAINDQEVIPTSNEPAGYTSEDLARVRAQEKEKLYPQLEKMKDELAALKREKEERDAQEAAHRSALEEAQRRKEEEELDVRSLLEKKEKEFSSQLEAERLERERAFALLEQERNYQDLMNYRSQRLEEERENIMPELIDLIDGSSPEDIERSIAGLKDRSARIVESAQTAMSSARREMTGSRITSPAAGPLDNDPEKRPVTPDDVRNMSLADYAKNRARLLGGASNNGGRGLFG